MVEKGKKSDWFVYIDENCREAITYGYVISNMTETEARKAAQENIMKHFDFDEYEGALRGTWQYYLDAGAEYIQDSNVITMYRVSDAINIPVMSSIFEMEKELERQKKVRVKQNQEQEIADLKRLQDKYPELANS